jgi:hypothetical protein
MDRNWSQQALGTLPRIRAAFATLSFSGTKHRWWPVIAIVAVGSSLLAAGQTTFQGTSAANAQSTGETTSPTIEQPTGKDIGNYHLEQTIELGGRVTAVNGNPFMYMTFTNLQSGPRLLSQSLFMRSINHTGTLFDTLSLTSFGWGGDPEQAAMLRASKYKYYNFTATFRRYQNFFDYDLLANPLNPPTSTPNVPVLNSPHEFSDRHQMTDLALTLLPQSRVSFRLGYSHNSIFGSSFSSVHEGTEALLLQPYRQADDIFRIGADLKLLPKTTISYDQFIQYDRSDTDPFNPFFGFQLPNGVPVDLGITWATPSAPCASPIAIPTTTPPTATASCAGFLDYFRTQRARTFTPTEQLTFISNYFRKFEITARAGYSNSYLTSPNFDFFSGKIPLFNQAQSTTQGPVTNENVSVWTDVGVTIHVTDRFRILENFRFNAFRIPGLWAMSQTNLFFPTIPGLMTDTPCLANPTTCAQHTNSSGPDLETVPIMWFLGENDKLNRFQLEYDFTKRLGGRIGYQYRHRLMHNAFNDVFNETFFPTLPNRGDCAGVPLNPDGSCTTSTVDSEFNVYEINEHTGLAGLWARPIDTVFFDADVEFTSANNSDPSTAPNLITRIEPRQQQRVRARLSYRPRTWATLTFAGNVMQARNSFSEIFYRSHNRNFSFNGDIGKERFGMDVAYNFNNFASNSFICFVSAFSTAPTTPCIEDNTLNQAYSTYGFTDHYGSTMIRFKPIPRVSTQIGYSIVSVTGNSLFLNPLQPLGPLSYNYHQPLASLSVEVYKGVTLNGAWNYYDYLERGAVGPTAPRNFTANLGTLSLRYAF